MRPWQALPLPAASAAAELAQEALEPPTAAAAAPEECLPAAAPFDEFETPPPPVREGGLFVDLVALPLHAEFRLLDT